MDRKAWIVIIACSFGLYFWLDSQKKYQKEFAKQQPTLETKSEGEQEEADSIISGASDDDSKSTEFLEKTVSLKNDAIELIFTNDGGGIKEANMLNHYVYSKNKALEKGLEESPRIVLNSGIKHPIGALSGGRDNYKNLEYEILEQEEGRIVLKAITAEKLEVTKLFTLTKSDELGKGHIVNMTLQMRYLGEEGNVSLNDYYIFTGASGKLDAGNSGDIYTGLEYLSDGDDEFRNLSYLKKDKDDIQGKELLERLQWLGVSNQFFSTNIYLKNEYESKI